MSFPLTGPIDIEGGVVLVSTGDLSLNPSGNIVASKDVAPSVDGTLSIGSDPLRFQKVWSDDLQSGNIGITGNTISSTNVNGNINLTPNGTGTVVLDSADINGGTIDGAVIGGTVPADGTFTQVDIDNLNIDGNTISSTNVNGNINLTPNGTGTVVLASADINGGTIDGAVIGGTVPADGTFTQVDIDNLNIDGNTITSTDPSGNMRLIPAGPGSVIIPSVDINGGTIDGTPIGSSVRSTAEFTQVFGGNIEISGNEISTPGAGNINLFSGGVVLIPNVDINGGTIDGTPIGSGSRSTGEFTQVFGGNIEISGNEISTPGAGNINFMAGGKVTIPNADLTGSAIGGTNINNSPIGDTIPETGAFTNLSSTDLETGTVTSPSGFPLVLDGSNIQITAQDHIIPVVPNTHDLGAALFAWRDLYVQNAPVITSDERAKKDVENVHDGLKEVLQMRPVKYNLIENSKPSCKKSYGFIAQELEKIVPEVVSKPSDYPLDDSASEEEKAAYEKDVRGVRYEYVIPILVNAIKELSAKVDALESASA